MRLLVDYYLKSQKRLYGDSVYSSEGKIMQMQNNHYYVYIVGEQQGANIQIGIADDLHAHMTNASTHSDSKMTDPELKKLVYYEHYDQEEVARNRERQIKENSRDATFNLVASMNPNWLDLSDTLTD